MIVCFRREQAPALQVRARPSTVRANSVRPCGCVIGFVAKSVRLHGVSLPQWGKGDHEVVDEVFQVKVTFVSKLLIRQPYGCHLP